MDDKSYNRDWEREAAEAKICLNCTKPKCTGGRGCFKDVSRPVGRLGKGKKGRRRRR